MDGTSTGMGLLVSKWATRLPRVDTEDWMARRIDIMSSDWGRETLGTGAVGGETISLSNSVDLQFLPIGRLCR